MKCKKNKGWNRGWNGDGAEGVEGVLQFDSARIFGFRFSFHAVLEFFDGKMDNGSIPGYSGAHFRETRNECAPAISCHYQRMEVIPS